MDANVVAALIAASGGIIVAIIAAYATARATSKKELEELRQTLAVTQLKTDTLWEIYAEDAIRSARERHLIAAQSAIKPTSIFTDVISEELRSKIETDAATLSEYIVSPYDIAVEIWLKYKIELVSKSNAADVSIRATWGAVMILCENAVNGIK